MTNGQGCDVILDPVLGTFFDNNLNCLAKDARWVVYGAMGGTKIKDANLIKLIGRRASLMTSTLRDRSDDYKTRLIQDFERDCIPAFEDGSLKIIMDSIHRISEAEIAFEKMSNNLNIGKMVLTNDM